MTGLSAKSDHVCHIRPLGILILTFVLSAFVPAGAKAEAGVTAAVAAPVRFDIPSQSLEDALMAYADAAGVEVFVEHALAEGQVSSPVHGDYGFETALRSLLAGTGLEIRRAAERAYTLVAPPVQEPPLGATPNWSADNERRQFFAALQLAVKQTLCARPETAPGQYRAALAVWIGQTGKVESARVLGANGRDQQARELVEDVQRISVGRPPPAGLEQPVTFVILPRSPDLTGDCAPPNSGRG